MGNADHSAKLNAGILEFIHEEYQRVLKNHTRKHLTLSEVLQLHSHEDYPFDFRHLGILFVCDRNLDGVFSVGDLEYLASWIQINLVSVQMYEFKSQLQARTVSRIIQTLDREDGEEVIISWFLRMLVADKESRLIGGCTYIKIECVKLIYEVLNVKMMSDLDIQSFFNLLKKSSEDLGFAIQEVREHEDDDDYEEYIEISVCSELIAHFLKGANKILKQIGYSHALL